VLRKLVRTCLVPPQSWWCWHQTQSPPPPRSSPNHNFPAGTTEFQDLSSQEVDVLRTASERACAARELSPKMLQLLLRKGLVYMEVPVGPTDRFAIPPLEVRCPCCCCQPAVCRQPPLGHPPPLGVRCPCCCHMAPCSQPTLPTPGSMAAPAGLLMNDDHTPILHHF
jgi:hypothetical protein